MNKNKKNFRIMKWMKNNELHFEGWEHRNHRTRKNWKSENFKKHKIEKYKKREINREMNNY